MDSALGCDVCREGVYSGGEPTFVAITSPADMLYRCRACGTWWIGNGRATWPATAEEAHERFPNEARI